MVVHGGLQEVAAVGAAAGKVVLQPLARPRIAGRGMTLRQLAEQLARVGHPMQASALAKIEGGDRRVDVDGGAVKIEGLPPDILRLAEQGEGLPGLDELWAEATELALDLLVGGQP